jgi:hypothetical protein
MLWNLYLFFSILSWKIFWKIFQIIVLLKWLNSKLMSFNQKKKQESIQKNDELVNILC